VNRQPTHLHWQTGSLWLKHHEFPVRLVGCFVSVTLATVCVGLENIGNLIWVANGLLLSYMLLAPRWRWPQYFTVGFAAQLAGGAIVHPTQWRMYLALTALNISEVAIGAFLLRRRSAQLPRFTDRSYLFRFIGYAVVAGPLATGLIFALFYSIWMHHAPWQAFRNWVITDGLGTAIATPACVAVFRARLRSAVNWKAHWLCPILLAVVTTAAFSQTRVPLLFLIYPLLIMFLLRSGLGWAALASLFVVAVGSFYTVRGTGPFAMERSFGAFGPAVLLQLHVASGLFMLYAISVVLERQKATGRRLRTIVALHRLVIENSRDAILVIDPQGYPTFASPAIRALTGWSPEETKGLGLAEVILSEDLPMVRRVIGGLRSGGESALVEHRIRKRNGENIWVEASVCAFADPLTGVSSGRLAIIRDITERKRNEQSRNFHLSLIGAIHEVSLDGILVVNEDELVVSLNKRFFDVWRVSAPAGRGDWQEEFINAPKSKLFSHCIDRVKGPEAFLKRIRELYADPDESDQCQFELTDGRTLERYSTCIRGEEGQYLGRVWFFRDISDRKQAEQRLRDAHRALEALAATDPLTRLANRRRFDQCLATEWKRGIRERRPLSLLLLDVDLFKSYNDAYGHLRGDRCLKQIAEVAMCVVKRPGDLVARFGGEEFAVVLPRTPNAGALAMADLICAALRDLRLVHSGNPLGYITISVGCATMIPELGQNAAILILKADDAMYVAKGAGRNQVCNADALGAAALASHAS